MISPDSVEESISPKTRLIVPVHFAGAAADMASLSRIAARIEVPLVEDAENKKGESHQDVMKKMGKLAKFKNREEMDAVIQVLRKML